MYNHARQTLNSHLRGKIAAITPTGSIVYEKWLESPDEWFCLWMEIYIIDFFGRENLCNFTDGGEGQSNPTLETRAKMSVARSEYIKTNGHPMLGKKHTEEAIQANREAHIGLHAREDHWTFGIPRPPETIAKIIENVPRGEEHALFGVKGEDHPAFGYKHPPEEIEEIRQASIQRAIEHPEYGFQKGRKSPNQGGETSGRAKLTDQDVWAIHDRYHLTKETIISIAGDRKRCGYMSNLLTGNIWPKVHAEWHAKNPGFEMRTGEHRKDPKVTARRVANLVPSTAEARTAKANKTWATRKQSNEEVIL